MQIDDISSVEMNEEWNQINDEIDNNDEPVYDSNKNNKMDEQTTIEKQQRQK